jgi:nucleoside-diphosphate-sugar epimerase
VRILLVGGTGAIGRALVPLLSERGHEVTATTRTGDRAGRLTELGAEPAVVDALDAAALVRVAQASDPEVVVCQVTSLSGDRSRFSELVAENARVRPVATGNTVTAAEAARARRVVVQGIAFAYGPGDGPATEEDPPRDEESARAAFGTDEAALASPLEVVVARYGYFYGPGTWYARDGAAVEALKAGALSVARRGEDSLVHVDDAATATVALVEGGDPDVYNVVDDEPAPRIEWMTGLAEAVAAPPPQLGEPFEAPRRGASNAQIKREIGWAPAYPSWREGFQTGL